MRFAAPLIPARLERRYKRFLADVTLDDGSRLTCHCPNTGSMLGCAEPGSRVWLSHSDSARRKYAHTWELVEVAGGVRVGIHTGRANGLVREALEGQLVPSLADYGTIRAEARLPDSRTRFDFHLTDHPDAGAAWVEVKNVTAAVDDGVALFPDAVTSRGTRHLDALRGIAETGGRAVLLFCVQREDVREVRPADAIDPAYGKALRRARDAGVEIHALGARVAPDELVLERALPVVCP